MINLLQFAVPFEKNGLGMDIRFENDDIVERAVREVKKYAENIVDTIRDPLLVLDADLRVVTASRSFYQTPDSIFGPPIYQSIPHSVLGRLKKSFSRGKTTVTAIFSFSQDCHKR